MNIEEGSNPEEGSIQGLKAQEAVDPDASSMMASMGLPSSFGLTSPSGEPYLPKGPSSTGLQRGRGRERFDQHRGGGRGGRGGSPWERRRRGGGRGGGGGGYNESQKRKRGTFGHLEQSTSSNAPLGSFNSSDGSRLLPLDQLPSLFRPSFVDPDPWAHLE